MKSANILILGPRVPFTSGGQEVLVRSLCHELRQRGHRVDIIEMPLAVHPRESLPLQCALWRSLELTECAGNKIDLVIATKFPSYYARHPRKSLWLVHQHRAIYDLFGTDYSDFSDDPRDEALRRLLVEGDNKVIGECSFVSGISRNVVKRLKDFNGIEAQPLYPPLPQGDSYYSRESDPYILSVGRLCHIKRVHLAIKALPFVDPSIKLKVVGRSDESGIEEYYKNEIDKHHLWDRVEFLGKVSEEELLELYSRALAVFYGPHDEDYGYVTLESLASFKPVITCSDSGGVLEFIKNEENGLVVEPDSEKIGLAIERLRQDPDFALRLGATGRSLVEKLGMHTGGWDRIVEGLLSPLNQRA